MDHGLVSVFIRRVQPFVLRVYKLVIVVVLVKQPVDCYVRVLDYNFEIVPDIMNHINAMVCTERKRNVRNEIVSFFNSCWKLECMG